MVKTTTILDRVAFFYVRRRLARFRTRHDHADQFVDKLTSLLCAEIERRHKLFDQFDADRNEQEAKAAEQLQRATAIQQFSEFGSGDTGRLQ